MIWLKLLSALNWAKKGLTALLGLARSSSLASCADRRSGGLWLANVAAFNV